MVRAYCAGLIVGLLLISGASGAEESCLTARTTQQRAQAFAEPTDGHGAEAALTYLRTLDELECFDEMADDAPLLEEKYCPDHFDTCDVVQRITRDIARLTAEELVKRADSMDKGDRRSLYARAAKAYMELWRKYGGVRCEEGHASCDTMEEVLWNAARAFAAAGHAWKSLRAYRTLINPRYHLEKTQVAKRALYEMARSYERIAIYDLAAAWYVRFADEAPKMHHAPGALRRATMLRLALGEEPRAERLRKRYVKRYGRRHRLEAALLTMPFAEHLMERGRVSAADRLLSRSALAIIVTRGDLHDRIHAFTLKARAMRLRGSPHAHKARERVLQDFKRVQKQGFGTSPEALRRWRRVLTDVGEVLFDEAEVARAEANAAESSTREAAIHRAEKQYLRVLKLQPAVPPRWAVRSAAAVAQMWRQLDRQHPSFVVRRKAKGAQETCVTYSEKYQHFAEEVRDCHAWLAKHYPEQHVAVDELAPSLRGGATRIRSAPLVR